MRKGLTFFFRRHAARAGFNHRRRRHYNQIFPVRWLTASKLIAVDVERSFEIYGSAEINDKLLTRLIESRNLTLTLIRRWTGIGTILTLYLLLSSFSIELPLSVEGISLKNVPGLNECLLFITTLISLVVLPASLNNVRLSASISAIERLLAPISLGPIVHSANFPSEPPLIYNPTLQPNISWTIFIRFISLMSIIFWLLFFFVAIIGILVSRIQVYGYVINNNALPDYIVSFIVFFAVTVDCCLLILLLIHIAPLPHRDFSVNDEIDIARQVNQETYNRLLKKYFGQINVDAESLRAEGFLSESEPPLKPFWK